MENIKANPLVVPSVWDKLVLLESAVEEALRVPSSQAVPVTAGRDVDILAPDRHPPKKGLSFAEGQARLLHDLASIELQAMELALRSLHEFPEAPPQFREEVAVLALGEGAHLRLCLNAMEELGFRWGHWPTHLALWQCVAAEDTLVDRVLIVHRYLEGSGLDAGETLLRRLVGVEKSCAHEVVETIVREEVDHVAFGSRWFRSLCAAEKRDPDCYFGERLEILRERLPKRIEPVSHILRRQAGFSSEEIAYLEDLRTRRSKFEPRRRRTDESFK